MTSFTLTCRINRCYITLGDVFKHGSSCWFLWEFSNVIDFLLAFLLEPLPRNLLVIPLATFHWSRRSWCLRWCHRRFDLQFHQAFGWCSLKFWKVWLYDGQGPEIPPSHGGWHRIYFSGEHLVFFVAWQSWNAVPQQFVFRGHIEELKGSDGMSPFHSMTPLQDVWVSRLPVWIGWNKYGTSAEAFCWSFFSINAGLFREGASSNTCICGLHSRL